MKVFEDLKHLLDAFSINVDVEELEEWLKQNSVKQKLKRPTLCRKNWKAEGKVKIGMSVQR